MRSVARQAHNNIATFSFRSEVLASAIAFPLNHNPLERTPAFRLPAMSNKRGSIFEQGKLERPYEEREEAPVEVPQRATAAQLASRKIKSAKPRRGQLTVGEREILYSSWEQVRVPATQSEDNTAPPPPAQTEEQIPPSPVQTKDHHVRKIVSCARLHESAHC
jgi:hypothetical protein